MLYQKYKNRGGPKHHGEKELPKGKPDCLKNLTFLRTGILDSLEGEEFENLVKEHGGKVVHGVSKKVNYLVVGEDPGPVKLDKARGLNIPEINEDEFLDMILVKSGMKAKFSKMISDVSIESGIATEEEPEKNKTKEIKKEEKVRSKSKDKSSKEEAKEKISESKKFAENKDSEKSKIHSSKPKEKAASRESLKEKNVENKESKNSKSNSSKPKEKTDSRVSHEEQHKLKDTPSEKGKPFKSEDLPQIDRPKTATSDDCMSWTEKYKPKDLKGIIGQQGDSSNMSKLQKWLKNWYRNQLPEVRKKIPRPSPWAKNDDGAFYKAALLSGPPGVGKTTTATLVSKDMGFDVVEFNASDTRSKRLLHEEVSQLLSTTTIAGFAAGKKTTDKKRVLLMDEVDGMAGNEDRGGIQELINLIKNTSIPIICMCNDRNHQKMRSLVNYCFDLRFNKPRPEQIRGAMMSICFKEGIKIPPAALSEIITGTGCDIRQTLNHLAMWSADEKNLSLDTVQKETKSSKKDTILGPWEVIKMVFSQSEHKDMTVADRSRLFFYDYSLGPLFVQENYLNVTTNCPRKDIMKRVALAADAISMGDLIDSKIRGSNNWSLLESQAIYSSVLPGFYMSGSISGRINFPGWLGKNSSANKHKRMLSELQVHTRISTSGNKMAMKLDYLLPLRNAIILPLKKYGTDGIHQAIQVMKAYNLLREDLTNLIELCQWKDAKNPFNDIDAKVKSAFTRAYNKETPLLPFAPGAGFSKKKMSSEEADLLDTEDFEESDTEEKDDVTADTMIKVKTKADKSKKESAKASTSKGKETSKGKTKTKKK
nr:replication factor C subunit 1 [Leptinotarsa decemlineata]